MRTERYLRSRAEQSKRDIKGCQKRQEREWWEEKFNQCLEAKGTGDHGLLHLTSNLIRISC